MDSILVLIAIIIVACFFGKWVAAQCNKEKKQE